MAELYWAQVRKSYILQKEIYKEIVLVGFSLGANLLLKYLGERDVLPKEIKKGDILALAAFGSGFSWGSAIIKW